MYRKLFLITCLVLLSLLGASGVMAEGPTTPEGSTEVAQIETSTPDEMFSVDASLGAAFTYQGRIKKDNSLVNGPCDMTFSLWDAASGGVQQGATQSMASVSISEGLFTVQLNGSGQFGVSAFNGQKRYLAIQVRCPAGSGTYITLNPRQELTATPYAIHAQHATALSAPDGTPLNAAVINNNGSLLVDGYDFALRGRGGGVGNNGGAGRALVDGGDAQGLVINWDNDFGKVRINGNVGIGTSDPQAKLDVAGTTRTDVLQIDGGADLAEPFAIAGQPESGQVVAIDPDHIGRLRIADQPYDRMVAGVISGAGGLRPGLTMQQPEIVHGDMHPVALSGRVYVWADASFGAIQPGDLLTTSATPGHAMKVTNHGLAQGAVLGKAMSRLADGKGLVLVLVALQ